MNVVWGSRFDEAALQTVLRGTGLDADLAVMAGGQQTVVGESGVTLSGGQRARVCLARAVYRCLVEPGPHLLLLDDPLSAVDGQTAARLVAFLRALPPSVAVVMTSHHTHLIADHERALLLEDGRLVQDGLVADVRLAAGSLAGLFAAPDPGLAKAAAAADESGAGSGGVGGGGGDGVAEPQLRVGRRERGRVGLPVYAAFFGPKALQWVCVAVAALAHFGLLLFLQTFLAALSTAPKPLSLMGEYGLLTGLNVALALGKTVLLLVVALRSASHLHSYLLRTLLRLTKCAADTTSAGVLVAAATSEMDTIDNKLAVAAEVVMRQVLGFVQVWRCARLGSLFVL